MIPAKDPLREAMARTICLARCDGEFHPCDTLNGVTCKPEKCHGWQRYLESADALLSGPLAKHLADLRADSERAQDCLQAAENTAARLSRENASLRAERDEARSTNREMHRRMQAVEGPLLARAEKAERAAVFWLERRKSCGGKAMSLRWELRAATARAEALEAENARLRAALHEAESVLMIATPAARKDQDEAVRVLGVIRAVMKPVERDRLEQSA